MPPHQTRGSRLGLPTISGSLVAALVVAAVLALVYLPTFAHALEVWTTDEEFSFAILVPPISLGLLWLRRASIRRSLGRGSNWGLLGVAGGLLMLLVSVRLGVHFIGGASFIVTALGAVAYLYGLPTTRVVTFPVAFLAYGLVLYRGLLNSLGFTLQGITAHASAGAATLVGVPVRREGVDLFVGQFHFVVAEACSGLSSLLALLCLGTLIVGLARTSLIRRLLLLVLVVPIVLVANIVRVTLVLSLAQSFGLGVAYGFVHEFFSIALFLSAFGLFLLAGSVLGCYRGIGATVLS